MTISETSIQKLQVLLKQQHGLECNTEQAQAAGRTILRLVGIKLYKQYDEDNNNDKKH